MDRPELELVVDAHATIGEGALWSAAERALYWIDIRAPALFRFDEASGGNRRWDLPAECGAFALIAEPPGALMALRDGLARLDLATGAVDRIADAPFDPALFRFNEGAVDASGRFWVGVMFDPVDGGEAVEPKQAGSLHSFSFATGLFPEPDRSTIHNGMAWSPDGRYFYLSHSDTGTIWRFPFDGGAIGAREAFAQVPSDLGVPDGAAMDAEGHYWCAVHGGGRLRRYAPDGSVEREVAMPVSQPTMCAFGGPDLSTLYVTTAAQNLAPGEEPHAGGLFRFRPGVAGTPKPVFVR